MQSYCKYNAVAAQPRPRRRGLTLIELVVVLAILVVLSGMVVPLIDGLGHQTNASTNATLVGDVNRAVRTYHARFDETYPNGWDSLLDAGGGLFNKLHPALTSTSSPLLQAATLTADQARSLAERSGIRAVYVHDATPPNATLTTTVSLTTGVKVAVLNSAAFANEAFNVNHLDNVSPTDEYVVLGLGANTTIRSAVMTDVPLVSSADPNAYYARVLCVFMIPGEGEEWFPAKYVGCFLPDGTSLRNNIDNYNHSAVSN
jgi:prepilin-type N-terminal cleavage/methylation domain-containing protein